MAGALTSGSPGTAPGQEAPALGVPGQRAAKVLLLLASGATLALLVAAMLRENFLASWQHHQRSYRTMLAGSKDPAQRKLGSSFGVDLRQVDLPALGTTDRCVSCHSGIDNPAMAGAAQPYRQHPGDFLKHHPVEKYGCTSCHQGQGAATNFHEAKATDVFWDYPLLPKALTQSSCGACHAADSRVIQQYAPALARGRQLFLDRGCQSCHKLDGVGGQLGPALDGEGLKIKHQLPMAHVKGDHTLPNWLAQHFDDPQGLVIGSKMRPPRLTPRENEALTAFMLSLRDRDLPQSYVPADRITQLARRISEPELDGETLYNRLCLSCHGPGTYGAWDPFFNQFMPAVRGPGLRAVADDDYLRTTITKGHPGTLMPAWAEQAGGLSAAQIDAVVAYLREGDGRPPQPMPEAPIPARGDAARGMAVFGQLCAGCHVNNPLGPSLSNPVLQAAASDAFLVRTIRHGRADTAMPAFQRQGADGLSDAQVGDVLAFLRSLGPPSPGLARAGVSLPTPASPAPRNP